MEIKDFQKLIRDIYYEKDSKRGLLGTFRWFVEEVGELARALRKRENDNLREEFADVFAWLVSLANLLEVDIDEAARERYGAGCPKCGSVPCKCSEPTEIQ